MSKRIRVVAALIVKDGKILIARRRAEGEFAGKWEFPGGKVEAGEEEKAALAREIREELGSEIYVGERFAELSHDYPSLSVSLVFYLCRIPDGPPPRAHAHEMLEWVFLSELERFDFLEADRPLLKRLQTLSPSNF